MGSWAGRKVDLAVGRQSPNEAAALELLDKHAQAIPASTCSGGETALEFTPFRLPAFTSVFKVVATIKAVRTSLERNASYVADGSGDTLTLFVLPLSPPPSSQSIDIEQSANAG